MKIGFFSFYSYIDVHAVPEAIVANCLKREGDEVVQIVCRGAFSSYCVAMSAAGLSELDDAKKKESICNQCIKNSKELGSLFSLTQIDIANYLSQRDCETVQRVCDSVTIENWSELVVNNCPIGRYAAYEFALNYKLNSIDLPKQLWEHYLKHLQGALIALFAGERFLKEFNPERVVFYNNFYSCNRAIAFLADKFSIPQFSLHAGNHLKFRLSEITVFKGLFSHALTSRHEAWRRYSNKALTQAEINRAYLHIKELRSASSPWVYSTKVTGNASGRIRDFVDSSPQKKVVVAVMSSGDESFGSWLADGTPPRGHSIFKNQNEWIEFLIDHIKSDPNYLLIIRVHPREFPNKREGILSQQAITLSEKFLNLPNNIIVNWPEDNLSLGDLISISDLCLNQYSTSALEFLLSGIPVVIHSTELNSYPKEFNYIALSKREYFLRVQEALASGRQRKRAYQVFQWIAYRSMMVGIDISDIYEERGMGRIQRYFYRAYEIIKNILSLNNHKFRYLKWNRVEGPHNAKWLTHAIKYNLDSHILDYINSCDSKKSGTIDGGVEHDINSALEKLGIYFLKDPLKEIN